MCGILILNFLRGKYLEKKKMNEEATEREGLFQL